MARSWLIFHRLTTSKVGLTFAGLTLVSVKLDEVTKKLYDDVKAESARRFQESLQSGEVSRSCHVRLTHHQGRQQCACYADAKYADLQFDYLLRLQCASFVYQPLSSPQTI
jgi:hypothetical protein